LPITRQNGSVRVSSRYSTKTIKLQGIITGTSQANLEANIDSFKELFSRLDKNLDIDWNGATRRYVASCIKHDFDRDHFHLLFVPWTAEFLVPLGVGTDTSSTSLYDTSSITAVTTNITLTFAGSAQPKPIFTIDMTTVGSAQVIELINNDTGQYIKIDGPFSNSDTIIVNCNTLSVTKNAAPIVFRGALPSFYIGANSFSMIIIGHGSTEDQTQPTTDSNLNIDYDDGTGIPFAAQSFTLEESGYIDYIDVIAAKDGSPTGSMYFQIYNDNNNSPGTLLGSGGYSIAAASLGVPTTYSATFGGGSKAFLNANTKYWIVLNPSTQIGTDASNYFTWWAHAGISLYPTGKAMALRAILGGYLWENGLAHSDISPERVQTGNYVNTFTIYRGSGGAANHSIRLRISYTKTWL
jgi:hypothetical protein